MEAADLLPDPLAQFARWLDEARAAGIEHAGGDDARDRGRLRSALGAHRPPQGRSTRDGFSLLHEHREPQGDASSPRTRTRALVFHWPLEPRRQVTVAGHGRSRSPREESEAYFRTRPLGSRLGAWASRQSAVIPDRAALDRAYAEAEAAYGDDPPLPPWWGGYLLPPDAPRVLAEPREPPARPLPLHAAPDGSWALERLAP